MRLYNFLKNNLSLTRLELMEYTKAHKITVNGKLVSLSTLLSKSDVVFIDDKEIKPISMHYYLYYKPRGILSTVSGKENSFINQISLPFKVSPAGRLDKESEGLMILSNDGDFLNTLTGDKSVHEKEYIVKVLKEITDDFLIAMEKSYYMDGRYTIPARVKKIDAYTFSIILMEGLYHQIRRLVKNANNSVLELKRIRIGNYTLKDMRPKDLIEFQP